MSGLPIAGDAGRWWPVRAGRPVYCPGVLPEDHPRRRRRDLDARCHEPLFQAPARRGLLVRPFRSEDDGHPDAATIRCHVCGGRLAFLLTSAVAA